MFVYIYTNVCLFILRGRGRACMWPGEGQRERKRGNLKQAPCCQHTARCGDWSHDCESTTWAEIKSWCLTSWAIQVPLKLLLWKGEQYFFCLGIDSPLRVNTERFWEGLGHRNNLLNTKTVIITKCLRAYGLLILYYCSPFHTTFI